MGIFDGIMGNASEMSVRDVRQQFSQVLAPNESIEKAYKLIRDLFIFTNKRLILVDKQGITGKKVEIHSIPYRSITHFSIETAGNFDLDAELKIWISGSELPVEKTFNKSLNIYELQSVLAEYVLQ
ncbi:PH domain-containing protein [Bacillus lacus]|uniref:PH domain-containing protein n=1 Tax=Metabacillus lacus TaxID=1983721 RepID=A0A7X2IX00_9BACI|nr:PH domain-containing protein [Metabacillus lacus]MRX71185.1 PH domain-containing protein [Metabacillus lacus]